MEPLATINSGGHSNPFFIAVVIGFMAVVALVLLVRMFRGR